MTPIELKELKGKRPVVLISAYDAISARLADAAGADILLVGDTVGIEVLGWGSIMPVTLDMMIHHVRAVSRGASQALIVADMPFGSYGVRPDATVAHACRLVKEAGARAVKVAGGLEVLGDVRALCAIGIPVMGHIGIHSAQAWFGAAPEVVGGTREEEERLIEEAAQLEAAGCFALIAKCVSSRAIGQLSSRCRIPVISIGSGRADGVGANFADLMGLAEKRSAWFSLRQWEGGATMREELARFVSAVQKGDLVPPARE
ncbi:MAG TPA: 3-methyl-2-oxobutanoate hydroxymethyltransferase [Chloroflexota bacterium]|nr:3-methyl-2-oxobutanoate hydroxymethyltransferase [Chloroflexota bacterium]